MQESNVEKSNTQGSNTQANNTYQDNTPENTTQKSNNPQSSTAQSSQLTQAMKTLENFVHHLSALSGEGDSYADALWSRIQASPGVLKELAYYHDYGKFWGQYKVADYSLTDILVWQVDHFKAYLDRHEEVNRWKPERLLLHSLDVMLQMEQDPAPIVVKLQGETGTDFVGKFKEF